MRFSKSWFWPVLLLGLLLSGCSGAGDAERVTVYPVSGKVTMNGSPVADAAVTFSPKGDQPVAVGRTDASGQYILTTYEGGDGAAAGEYTVLVTKEMVSGGNGGPGDLGHDPQNPEAFGTPPEHGAQQSQQAGSLLPLKYSRPDQSPLEATVTADGDNKFDFSLEP